MERRYSLTGVFHGDSGDAMNGVITEVQKLHVSLKMSLEMFDRKKKKEKKGQKKGNGAFRFYSDRIVMEKLGIYALRSVVIATAQSL